ncbi:MAG: hypothetical protein LBT48_00310 [Prevotellaceae bacterium]|jgi:hypothetical protein|nr:hypothetical protein [Prevotellaceae bacterium]
MKKIHFIFCLVVFLVSNVTEAQVWKKLLENSNGTKKDTIQLYELQNLRKKKKNPDAVIWDGYGKGTKENPYKIQTAKQLDDLRHYLGKQYKELHFKLMNDIDLSSYPNWEPIGSFVGGNEDYAFAANLDGNKKSIKNLTISRPNTNYVGLFGYVRSTSLTDLSIHNYNIVGQNMVGCISGAIDSSKLERCSVAAYSSESSIKGISQVGSIAGLTRQNTITSCTSTAKVSGDENVGGFIGYSIGDSIVKSFVQCIVIGLEKVGEFIGASEVSTIIDSRSNQSVERKNDISFGVFSGYTDNVVLKNTYSLSKLQLPRIIPWPGGGSGTKEDPYQIKTAEHLDSLRHLIGYEHKGLCFIITDDIDLSSYENWQPIGVANVSDYWMQNPFTGTLDGNNRIIKNLTINRPTENFVGLFAAASAANLFNIVIENCSIIGQNNVGALVATIENSTVRNCSVSGYIQGENIVGGFGATMTGNIIDRCAANVSVFGDKKVGGFVGSIGGKQITNSYSSGIVKGAVYVGGFAGYGSAAFTYCYSSADVHADSNAAGFSAFSTASINIQNCIALNSSIRGENASRFIRLYIDTNIPPIIGFNFAIQEMLVNGELLSESKYNGTNASRADLQTAKFYSNPHNWRVGFQPWDISNGENTIWTIWENNSYPYLSNQSAPVVIEQQTLQVIQGQCKINTDKIKIYKNGLLEGTTTPSNQQWEYNFTNSINNNDVIFVVAYEKDKSPSYAVISN